MKLLKYFENFLNEEKLYKKLYSVVRSGDTMVIKYEATGSLEKKLKEMNPDESLELEELLKPEFEKISTSDSKSLLFRNGAFSLEILQDDDYYYYMRYDKMNTYQYFECDVVGLSVFIKDLKEGKFDHYFSNPMTWS